MQRSASFATLRGCGSTTSEQVLYRIQLAVRTRVEEWSPDHAAIRISRASGT